MLEYIIDIEKEKHDLETKFSDDYKKMKKQLVETVAELDQAKASYRDLLSKFSGKEIQIRGYRLALNNANELLYEVIDQIENSISHASIPLKGFINSMNMKIMKLLENSTKELHTLTDINPQSSYIESEKNPKDPIEDAFNHLRSLLTFQTSLKKSSRHLSDIGDADQPSNPKSNQDFSPLSSHHKKSPEVIRNISTNSEKSIKERK